MTLEGFTEGHAVGVKRMSPFRFSALNYASFLPLHPPFWLLPISTKRQVWKMWPNPSFKLKAGDLKVKKLQLKETPKKTVKTNKIPTPGFWR